MVFRPATPGFIITLTATIILAVVSFNVPLLKSVYFLRASLAVENVQGIITLGTLGYCIELSTGTTCSKPTIGYEFNPNQLLGDNITFAQIPEVVVRWITFALFLHVIALIIAAISALFGLLAHVREISMTCFSSCFSGFAATIALVAFIFDIVLFFLVKTRINSVSNGSATIGNAVWLTLAAWVLLFFSGCFYGFGRCCLGRRPRGSRDPKQDQWAPPGANNGYAEQVRLDAVKAEADRKARQRQAEGGLPAFQEHEVTKPLNAPGGPQYLEDDEDESSSPYRDHHAVGAGGAGVGAGIAAYNNRQASGRQPTEYRGGYVQAPPGTRAVDEYYSPTTPAPNTTALYPPQPSRRQSTSTHTQTASNYARSDYAPSVYGGAPGAHDQYLSTTGQTGHGQYPSGQAYGHTAGGTTYHSTASHQQYPSNYQDSHTPQQAYDPEAYNATGVIAGFANRHTPSPGPYQSATPMPRPQQQNAQSYISGNSNYYTPPAQPQPERNYSLGGGGYGTNVVPNTRPEATSSSYFPYEQQQYPQSRSPPINTNVASGAGPTSPRGPRGPRGAVSPPPDHLSEMSDSPPSYDAGTSELPGAWAEKR